MTFRLTGDQLTELVQRLNLRTHQRTIMNQTYTIRRQAYEIARAGQASTLYHLLAVTSTEARLIAWLGLKDEAVRQQIVRFQSELRDVAPLIDGNYLKQELGLPPGPIYRQIIDALRDARLDGRVTTLEDERALVEQIRLNTDSKDDDGIS
jgi:hypothetical protein